MHAALRQHTQPPFFETSWLPRNDGEAACARSAPEGLHPKVCLATGIFYSAFAIQMPQHKLSHAVNTATHGLVAAPLVAAQTTRRWWQDFSFTGYMTPASRVFLALMVVELLTVVGLTIQRMIHPTTSYSERYAVLMLVDVCILFFFAVNGVLGENSFEVLAFILVTLVFCGVTIYQFFWSPANTEQVVLWIRFIAVCAFTPANCLLAILVYRGFGWRMYRKVSCFRLPFGNNKREDETIRRKQGFQAPSFLSMVNGVALLLTVRC